MDHHCPEVLDLLQTLDEIFQGRRIVQSEKCPNGVQPLINDSEVETWSEEVLPEKVLALRCIRQVVEEPIDRETFFGSRRSSGGPLVVRVRMRFGL